MHDDVTVSVGLLYDLQSGDSCHLDHNGACQSHCWFEPDAPCPQSRLKKIIDNIKKGE